MALFPDHNTSVSAGGYPSGEKREEGGAGQNRFNPDRWMRLLIAAVIGTATFGMSVYTFLSVDANQQRLLQNVRRQAMDTAEQADPAGSYDESLLAAYVGDHDQEVQGRELFALYCADCHGDHGEGSNGPDLTDINLSFERSHLDVFRTITDGIPDKGMPAWRDTLSSKQRAQLVAFVRSIQHARQEAGGPD